MIYSNIKAITKDLHHKLLCHKAIVFYFQSLNTVKNIS